LADPPRYPENEEDSGVNPDRGPAKSKPRWVFALGIVIAIALVLLIVLLHATDTVGPNAH
jgi:hypothetical protein